MCALPICLDDAMAALEDTGLPAIIRPSFTLGGTGGGIAYNREDFVEIVRGGLEASPTTEVLIEESVLGWKEYEMEVVRDRADNSNIISSNGTVDRSEERRLGQEVGHPGGIRWYPYP